MVGSFGLPAAEALIAEHEHELGLRKARFGHLQKTVSDPRMRFESNEYGKRMHALRSYLRAAGVDERLMGPTSGLGMLKREELILIAEVSRIGLDGFMDAIAPRRKQGRPQINDTAFGAPDKHECMRVPPARPAFKSILPRVGVAQSQRSMERAWPRNRQRNDSGTATSRRRSMRPSKQSCHTKPWAIDHGRYATCARSRSLRSLTGNYASTSV